MHEIGSWASVGFCMICYGHAQKLALARYALQPVRNMAAVLVHAAEAFLLLHTLDKSSAPAWPTGRSGRI